MYMSMENIEKLRCFENTRDYAKLNDLMYRRRTTCMYVESCALEWIWINFPASLVVWKEAIVITYLMSLSITLLNLYCTVCICIYACMFLELLACSLSRSITNARSIHQKFYVNILICWNKSHSFFLVLRFVRKYRFGFHNKNLPRTIYYCTVYARIHLLLKKEKIACQIFFLVCSSLIQSYLVFQRHFNTQALLQNIKARRKPFYSYCRYHPVWANWKISDLSFEGILLSTQTLICMTFDNDKFVSERCDPFCLR